MSEPTAINGMSELGDLRCRLDAAEKALCAERERAEEERRDDARHQDEFLRVLVHDLRNALMPIGNAIEILQAGNVLRGDQQAAQHILTRQLRELGDLVNVLADAARVHRGVIDLHKRPLAIAEVIDRAVVECRSLIDHRRHHLSVSLPAEAVWVRGDPERLSQIVRGLLVNAAHFTEPGGSIQLTAASSADGVEVRIADTGLGIAPEFLPHIFDLFTKAAPGDNRPRRGLGVGLAIIRTLTELHDGSVQALSDGLGQGSTFFVRLPILADSAGLSSEPEPIRGTASLPLSRRILIVSDNIEFAQEWSLLLRVAGHAVQIAASNSAALDAFTNFQPEVLSLDLSASASDVQRLSEHIRQGLPERRPCVIGLVYREIAPNERRRYTEYCDAVLAAPIKIRDFLKVIADKESSSPAPAS